MRKGKIKRIGYMARTQSVLEDKLMLIYNLFGEVLTSLLEANEIDNTPYRRENLTIAVPTNLGSTRF